MYIHYELPARSMLTMFLLESCSIWFHQAWHWIPDAYPESISTASFVLLGRHTASPRHFICNSSLVEHPAMIHLLQKWPHSSDDANGSSFQNVVLYLFTIPDNGQWFCELPCSTYNLYYAIILGVCILLRVWDQVMGFFVSVYARHYQRLIYYLYYYIATSGRFIVYTLYLKFSVKNVKRIM
jgi:hypothetical protein